MTYSTFPTLAGLSFDCTKTPTWSTQIRTSASGKEQRAANWSYPRYKFSLVYEFLRANVNQEFQTLLGFCNLMQGQFSPFYFQDPTDSTVTGQELGLGDGTTKQFALVRTIGGYTEPIHYTPLISAVYLNGVAQTPVTAWTASTILPGFGGANAITFVTPPASGTIITADFTYCFVCRFLQDDPEFNYMLSNLWELKQLSFTSIK